MVFLGACAAQIWSGYTPAGRAFWQRAPAAWPVVTAHDRLLARFAAQIPPGEPLSTTADLYPHVSHRALLYQFPEVGEARWVLVDVAGTTDRHPAAIHDQLQVMVGQGWGVVDAADGYLLLGKDRASATLPDAFYDFARAGSQTAVRPQYPLDITFGDAVKLLGYDVMDDLQWRRTALRFYWQALAPLPGDLNLNVQVRTPDGTLTADTAQAPMAAALWYPPAHWQPGETVAVETLPSYFPATWAPIITMSSGGRTLPGAGCQRATGPAATQPTDQPQCYPDGRVVLPASSRINGVVAPEAAGVLTHTGTGARFQGPDWQVRLAGYHLPAGAPPGGKLPVGLEWSGWDGEHPGPAPRSYTIFMHLRDAAGHTVANTDATPAYFVPMPTDAWRAPGPNGMAGLGGPDAHSLAIPAGLAPGRYRVVIGWYNLASGQRLTLVDEQGNATGDEYVLGEVQVDPAQAKRPDLACLVAPEACASQ